MGEVIVVTSGKGGVGKTTVSANLGTALALAGKRVALVDADIGLRNLDVVMGLENRIVYDLVHVIEGYCRLRQALVRDKRVEGLYLLPAAQTRDKSAVSPDQMKVLCTHLKQDFDFVIIDCPAGIEQGFRNSVAGADRAVIVTTPELSAIRDADRIIGLLEVAEIPDPKLIVNRYRPEMVEAGNMMSYDDVVDMLAVPLLGVIPDSEDIVISTNRGAPIVMEGRNRIGESFRRIAARIQGFEVPFLSHERPKGFFKRMAKAIGLGGAQA